MSMYKTLTTLVILTIIVECVLSENGYFLKAAKNVPRIGRRSKQSSNIDEMGKFFMKASKSVPRIGRRNEKMDYEEKIEKRENQGQLWADIAERFEFDPEMFASPDFIEQLEMSDDPKAYEMEEIRNKRTVHPKFYFY